jgi:hypothetical protein
MTTGDLSNEELVLRARCGPSIEGPRRCGGCSWASRRHLCRGSFARRRPLEEADEFTDGVVAVQRVAKWKFVVDLVLVAASVARLGQVAGLLEIPDELGGGSFRDAEGLRDVSEARGGIGGKADEHVCVVGDEGPNMITITGICFHE